jgi:hypothetical protein
MALSGTQATYGHSPPTRPASTRATERPPAATVVAMCSPADPAPSTTTSKDCWGCAALVIRPACRTPAADTS